MKAEKPEIELETRVKNEVGSDGRITHVPIVDGARVRAVLPSLIKIAAVELARRDAKRS